MSTPELGVEIPVAPKLRRCVSSTELLYEKAMQRFYKAVKLEETENNRRSASVETHHVPHELPSSRRRLGSFGEADALERRNSFKKKFSTENLSGPQKPLKTEIAKAPQTNPTNVDEDTVSISDDRDLKREILDAHRKLRDRHETLTPTSSMEFEDDYTESTASSGSMTSMDSMEQFKNVIRSISKDKSDELDTYNPMMSSRTVASSVVRTIDDGAIDTSKIKSAVQPLPSDHLQREAHFEELLQQSLDSNEPEELWSESEEESEEAERPRRDSNTIVRPSHDARALSPYRTPEDNQSSIELTRPLPLPDPDFVPKPILKRPSIEETPNQKPKDKSKTQTKKNEKKEKTEKKDKAEKKGGLLQMFKKTTSSDEKKETPPEQRSVKIDDVATTKMSAAALAKKKSMERRQSSLEENKVAIDHYSDIVNAVGVHRTPKVPIYLSVDDLKKVAEKEASEKRKLTTQNSVTSNVSTTSNTSIDPPRRVSMSPVPPLVKSNENDKRSIFAIKLSKDPKKMAEVVAKPPIDFSRSVSIGDEPTSNNIIGSSPQPEEAKSSTRGRTTTDDSTPKKRTPSSNRSRSSSTVRKASVQREPSQTRLPPSREPSATRQRSISKTRATSKTRNQNQSKSPSGRNRTLHVARIGIRDRLSVDSPEPSFRSQTPEQLLDEAEKTVKSTMAYALDISMLIVASWVYMFKDARLVVPILVLLVYRQISSALKDKMPNWMKRKRASNVASDE